MKRLHALVLAAVAVWCFVAAFIGGLLGLVLGNLRLPVLLLFASSPAAGAGANIGISAVSAATAAGAHIRAGRVDWRIVGWMTPPSIAGAVGGAVLASGALLGARYTGRLNERSLLRAIAVVLLVSGGVAVGRGAA